MKRVNKIDDFPKGDHFAILIFSSFPYDDGYGGTSYRDMVEYQSYDNVTELETEISRLETKEWPKKKYKVIASKSFEVQIETKVKLS